MKPEDKINTLHKMEQYQKVNDEQLIKIIPLIKDIYYKFYKEYFKNEELNENWNLESSTKSDKESEIINKDLKNKELNESSNKESKIFNEDLNLNLETSTESDKESEILINNSTKNFNINLDINEIEDKYYNTYIIKQTLPKESKIIYLGDYHSSVHSLIDIIINLRNKNILTDEYKLADNYYIVFLGDIVDRGPLGIECLYIIYLLFLINNSNEKERVFILNGNHEEKETYSRFDFHKELEYQLKPDTIKKVEELIRYLPFALFIKIDEQSKWYQFCHGGIDKHQLNFENFRSFLDSNTNYLTLSYKTNEVVGFLWSDFITIEKYILIFNNIFDELKKYFRDNIEPKFDSLQSENEELKILEHENNIYEDYKKNRNKILYIIKNKSVNINYNLIYNLVTVINNLLLNHKLIWKNINKLSKEKEKEDKKINLYIERFDKNKNKTLNYLNFLKRKIIKNHTNNLLNLINYLQKIKNNEDYSDINLYMEYGTRPLYNNYQVASILENLNIKTIISGHIR